MVFHRHAVNVVCVRSESPRLRDSARGRLLLLIGLWLAAVDGSAAAELDSPPGSSPLPIEFQPYRIHLVVTSDPQSQFAARARAELESNLPSLLDRSIGPRWEVRWTADESTAAIPQPAEPPSETVDPSAPPVGAPLQPDVEYRIVVSGRSGEFAAAVDAYEPLWDWRSPRRMVRTSEVRELPSLVVQTLAGLFRPRALWERLDETQVRLRVQGGALADPDPALPLLHRPEMFEPWIFFMGRGGVIQRKTAIPFTLCVLGEDADGRGTGTVVSGLKHPLSSRPRGRVQLMAVACRALWPATDVEFVSRSQPPRLLVAHNVTVHRGRIDPLPEQELPPLELITDRRGRVRLDARSEVPWVMLGITSGDQPLAEVPLVPGAASQLRLELQDDLLRLRVEGQLRLLQGEMVSIVAERTALMLAARAAAKRSEWSTVDSMLNRLQNLPTPAKLRERISGIRVPAVADARRQKDVLTERRIERLCDETDEMLQRHLADEKIRLIVEEMAELKSAAKEIAAEAAK